MPPCSVQKNRRADDVRLDKSHRPRDGAIHMRLGGKAHHRIKFPAFKNPLHRLHIRNVRVVENVAPASLRSDIREVRRITRIRERIEIMNRPTGTR